ncbi:carbohydrate ABC transporter permease [Halorussus salinisoli]|uniref:carbohydrate ABC transporter permease n=1 Tax=Halorussus salinisoli TaxID=2558242 RepID=UPI0010C2054C|nr:sugar ABC transporter permease [Halorussus salinisoli]
MSLADKQIGARTLGQRYHAAQDAVFEFLSRKWVLIGITVVPVMALFVFVNLLPIAWAINASFHSTSIYSPDWTWSGIENYQAVLTDGGFWISLWRSLLFAGGSVVLQLIAGTALALIVNRSFKFANFARAVAMLPYLIPTAVLGFIALWMGNSQYGIISDLLVRIGALDSAVPWYGSTTWALPAVILTSSWKFTLFVTIMVLARLQSIPEGFYEAATVSGANAYHKFRDITLPNLKGVIFIVLLLRGIWMFNKFDIIWVLTRGGPKEVTSTAPIYAYEVAFNSTRLGRAAATSALLFLILVIGAFLYFTVLEPEEEVRVE